MGLIMTEKCATMLIKCESVEVFVIDDLSQDSVLEQITVPVKQEADRNTCILVKVKSECQGVNDLKPFIDDVKEENKDDVEIQVAELKHNNINSENVNIKCESLKTELIEITDEDSSSEEEEVTIISYTCKVCHFTSPCNDILRNHILVHSREKPYKCHKCEYATGLNDLFNSHMSSHAQEKLSESNICQLASNRRDSLNEHTLMHIREEPIKCRTEFEANLSNQTKITSRKKPFRCNKCEHSATTRMDLRRHSLMHSGKKPLECNKCGYKTLAKSHLRAHVRTHFENRVKSYKCSACKSRFLYKASLLRHMNSRPCKPGHS